MADYAQLTELLGWPNTQVTHYQLVGTHRLNLFVESTVEAAMRPAGHAVSLVVHDRGEPQFIRDLSIWNRRCWLRYAPAHPRRRRGTWAVPRRFECAICQTTFVERLTWREPNRDYTQRYELAIYERARHEPISQIAQGEQLSDDPVQGIFECWAKKTVTTRGYPRVKVLCLDEIAPHKRHGGYLLIISAPELGLVLDVLKNLADAATKARRVIQKNADEATQQILTGGRCCWSRTPTT